MNLVETRADSAQRQKHGRRFETRRLGVEHSLRAHKAGEAWEDDAIKAEAGGDRARMLSARAAERNQRMAARIDAVADAERFDRKCHARVGDVEKR